MDGPFKRPLPPNSRGAPTPVLPLPSKKARVAHVHPANSPAAGALHTARVPKAADGLWRPSPFTDGPALRPPTIRKPNTDTWAQYDPTAPKEIEEVCLVGEKDTWKGRMGGTGRAVNAPRIIKTEIGDDPYDMQGIFKPQHPDFVFRPERITVTNMVTVLYLENVRTGRTALPISPQGVACFVGMAQSEGRMAFKCAQKRSHAPRHTEMFFPTLDSSIVSTGASCFYQEVWRNQRTLRDIHTFISPDIVGAAPGASIENIVATVALFTPVDFELLKTDPHVQRSTYFEGYHVVHPSINADGPDTINILVFVNYVVFTGPRCGESLRLPVARTLGYISRYADTKKKKDAEAAAAKAKK